MGAASQTGLGRTGSESASSWDAHTSGRIGWNGWFLPWLYRFVGSGNTALAALEQEMAIGLAVTALAWCFFTSSSCMPQLVALTTAWEWLGHQVREYLNCPANLCTDAYHHSAASGERMWGDMCPDAPGKMGNLFSNPSAALVWKATIQMLLSHVIDLVPVTGLVSWVLKFTWGFQTEHSELTEWYRSELEYLPAHVMHGLDCYVLCMVNQ